MIRKRITPPTIRRINRLDAEEEKLNKESAIVKFVPLGGLEEIGRNCAFFEYQKEIVVIDTGIQFPEEETPGIDFIIPNVSYLQERKHNVQGIILTHGHYDHIHALPYLIEKLGNPTIYATPFTREMILRRFEEFTNLSKPKIHSVKDGEEVQISDNFRAHFFSVDHTIPDAIGVILNTPVGKMVHFGDFRLEVNREGEPVNLEMYKKIGKMGVHSIFLDSTNSQKEGHTISERIVEENLEMLMKEATGRLIIASFSSLVTRIAEIIKIADKLGKKVALNGRSMKDNVQIAINLGYIKPKKGLIISLEETNKYKDDRVLILTTGGQGEPNAGLTRIANGEHPIVSLKSTDMVIFSSSVVPGNERSVQALQDNISRQVDKLFNSKLLDIHSSGHNQQEDLKLVIEMTKPKFVVPVHSYYFMRKAVVKLAEEVGFSKENVVLMDNGQVANLTENKFVVTDEKVPAFYVMVDGLGVGDVEEVVIRDRRVLSKEGMVVVIVTMNRNTGHILKNPDIISRGFIYLKENKEIIEEVRKKIRATVSRIPRHQYVEPEYVKTLLRDQIGQFLYTKTKRRPMIIPVIIEV